MSSVQSKHSSNQIDETLSQLRHWIRRYLSIRGLSLIGIFAVLFFWITGLIDYLPVLFGAQDSPRTIRVLFLATGCIGIAYLLWRFLIQPLAVHWSDRSAALLIERRYPSANNAIIHVCGESRSSRKPIEV